MEKEHCINCDAPTGKAGKYEDSHYCPYCDDGPFCDDCYEDHVAAEEWDIARGEQAAGVARRGA